MPTNEERARLKVWLTEARPAARDYFELLGVHKGSTEAGISQARSMLARLLHPDRWGTDTRRGAQASAAMAEVNAAHSVLTDKAKRTRYLAELAAGRRKCTTCKGEGYTTKQKGFTQRVTTSCATCGGSGLYKEPA